MLIPMVLFPYSRVEGEKIQMFQVTLRLFLDNLVSKSGEKR